MGLLMSRNLAIIGSYNMPLVKEGLKRKKSYEKWAMNNLFTAFRGIKFTRWFELHDFKKSGRRYLRRSSGYYGRYDSIAKYMAAINRLNIPVYMQKKWKNIKKSKPFPFQEVMETFDTEYFGCSFAWMIALALLEHLKGRKISKIVLLGVGLTGHEYYFQRPSTEYFCGIAKGLGVKIEVDTATSNILTAPYIYAYKENHQLIDINYVSVVKTLGDMISIPMQEYFERILL